MNVPTLIEKIQTALSPDLLKPEYRGSDIPLYGHCYVASEALYHVIGGGDSEYTPARARDAEGVVHWWLESDGGQILDPTAIQYESRGIEPPYEQGRRAGFLTKEPSRRARVVLDRVL
jgi:hypothetical protein